MTTTRCERPDCPGGGVISETGFCDVCFRAPEPGAPGRSAPPVSAQATAGDSSGGSRQGAARVADSSVRPAPEPVPVVPETLDLDGLVVLPDVLVADAAQAVMPEARVPSRGRKCGFRGCDEIVGIGYGGEPPEESGFCPRCGARYSFKPHLRPGDMVGPHYRVLGYLTPGGYGWVYLAEDIRVPDHKVVLKGQINAGDEVSQQSAEVERDRLTFLKHRDIVRIITYEPHQSDDQEEPAGYIVMEYIGGQSLRELLNLSDTELEKLFHGRFGIDHVVTYGCKILGALEYLHGLGLLYCDMKPDNVMHYGHEIKIIDLGAVREIENDPSQQIYDRHYAPPASERESRGFHIDTDLYTVGKTLAELATRATPATGLAARSFDRLIARATAKEPAARFTSAAEMSRQLWEVLRENRALTFQEQYPERSTRFEPTAELFGRTLGTVRGLPHWTERQPEGGGGEGPGSLPPRLEIDPPAPAEAAAALPVPLPDPDDPATVVLTQQATGSPERIAERAENDPVLRTVEAALWLCRAYLARQDTENASAWLDEAVRRVAERSTAEYDWRLPWHRGVLELVRGQVSNAADEFAATYSLLPGEWAPKLALGYCSESIGERDSYTEAYYEAVWQRHRSQGSAALGLVRVHLRRGEREAAVKVLDGVPTTSRHYDTARIAAVRILAGRVGDKSPTGAQLTEAARRLDLLDLDAPMRARLLAEIMETASACRPDEGWGPRFRGDVFGPDDTARSLDGLYFKALSDLADQVNDVDELGDLLDRAYRVRPVTTF